MTLYTIKLLTTSCRYNRLKNDLDFNAGEYLDGTPLEELATRLYDHNIKIASGELTFGEKAGHSQVCFFLDSLMNSRFKYGEIGLIRPWSSTSRR